jgi:hypothetical protein
MRPTLRKTVSQSGEGLRYPLAIQQRRFPLAHATSRSCDAMKTPRLRNAAGAWTRASTLAALVSYGNQNWRSHRLSAHDGAPRPSPAARCSASAASSTSQCLSPVGGGSSASSSHRSMASSCWYSLRNSTTRRQRSSSAEPVSQPARSVSVAGRYACTPCGALMPVTVFHRWRSSLLAVVGLLPYLRLRAGSGSPCPARSAGGGGGAGRPPACGAARPCGTGGSGCCARTPVPRPRRAGGQS